MTRAVARMMMVKGSITAPRSVKVEKVLKEGTAMVWDPKMYRRRLVITVE